MLPHEGYCETTLGWALGVATVTATGVTSYFSSVSRWLCLIQLLCRDDVTILTEKKTSLKAEFRSCDDHTVFLSERADNAYGRVRPVSVTLLMGTDQGHSPSLRGRRGGRSMR